MVDLVLTRTRIRAGVWEGVLTVRGEENFQPDIAVLHQTRALDGVVVKENPDRKREFTLQVPIPAELLFDGVQSFVITERGRDETLGHFTIVTGQPIDDDIRAEMDLLRAELDMLKRAFRRHCVETM